LRAQVVSREGVDFVLKKDRALATIAGLNVETRRCESPMLGNPADFIAVDSAPVAMADIKPMNRRKIARNEQKLLYITDGYTKYRTAPSERRLPSGSPEYGFIKNLLEKPLAVCVCAAKATRPVMPGFDNH
jgi:hypothetical protein